jgi:hypothetical protein
MSLIGSLEDLGLGDILQIISLSQKSGVLVIRSDEGEGRIAFADGLVRGAVVKGGPTDLRGVLVGGGFVAEEEFDDAVELAQTDGLSIDEALIQCSFISSERIDSLRREAVEAAVVRMFRWHTGEFSFDMRDEPDPDDPPLFLPTGINAQYLAMEGSRLDDEAGHQGGQVEPGADLVFGGMEEAAGDETEPQVPAEESPLLEGGFEFVEDGPEVAELTAEPEEVIAEPIAEPPEEFEAELVETVASAALESVDSPAELDADAAEVPEEESALLEAPLLEPLPEEQFSEALPPLSDGATLESLPPLVVIDSDLMALEWTKQLLKDQLARVHIFQRSELGLARIRQYLARGEAPLLLLSPWASGDPLSGIRDAADFVSRLKAQAPRMRVLWLCEDGREPLDRIAPADGQLVRPASYQFRNRGATRQLEDLGAALRQSVLEEARSFADPGNASSRAPGREISPEALQRLKRATAILNDASSRGEVLPLVIRFAGETFSRVAMFMVREDQVIGMAQSGLDRAGGPDDEALRAVSCRRDSCSWFRTAIGGRCSMRSAPQDDGDRALARLLGDRLPPTAYLAPIESAGQIVALLYADNLPGGHPIGDTSALEVVLHHAGLALDRAALERALAEADEFSGGGDETGSGSGQAPVGGASEVRAEGGSPSPASRNEAGDRYD